MASGPDERVRILGIEGTAWAASVAIYDAADGLVAMESRAYTPDAGGIHPREAAEHMADTLPALVGEVLGDREIDAVAFSRGPGLGPCLRIVGTTARTVAQARDAPLVGVNHMVAHLEIGRHDAGFRDPVCLNASGANAHVLGLRGGRYRVLGETMDTGVGNAIDKFARHVGWSHPGGPKVEDRARDGAFLELPYVVKGMDFSFSGIMSAAKDAYDAGEAVEDVCCSLQETIFAMLTEVSERALSLTGRDELVLGGGVGQNARLREMLGTMCADRGVDFHAPPARLLRDNAGMIAVLGAAMFAAGETIPIEDAGIRADFRPDEVPVTWRDASAGTEASERGHLRGAEATLQTTDRGIAKTRHARAYRHPSLDRRIRRERTAAEARLLHAGRRLGVPTPVVRDLDREASELTLEVVGANDLRDAPTPGRLRALGHHLAVLHTAGIVHGDPTVRNARVAPSEDGADGKGRVYLIDFGLGYHSDHREDYAMDLHVLAQSLEGTSDRAGQLCEAALAGYTAGAGDGLDAGAVRAQLKEISARGRYR